MATLFILYKMENYKQQKLFSLGVQCAVCIHACSSVKCNKSKTRHFHREHADKLKVDILFRQIERKTKDSLLKILHTFRVVMVFTKCNHAIRMYCVVCS